MTDEPEEEAEVDDDAEYDAEEEFEDRPLSPPDPDMPPLDTYKPVSVKQIKKVDAKIRFHLQITDEQVKRLGEIVGDLSTSRKRAKARGKTFQLAASGTDPKIIKSMLSVIDSAEKGDLERRESRTKGRKSRTADRQSKLEMYREALRGKAPRVGGFGSTG